MDVGATVTSKGQITLPKSVRDALGLKSGDRVLFRVHEHRAVLAKVPDFLDLAGTMPPPPGKTGMAWPKVRAQAWRRQAGSRERRIRGKNP